MSTVTTTSLSYNITGLDSNTAYKVIVSARNVLGSSNSSEVKGCTIPEGLYNAITKLYNYAASEYKIYTQFPILYIIQLQVQSHQSPSPQHLSMYDGVLLQIVTSYLSPTMSTTLDWVDLL